MNLPSFKQEVIKTEEDAKIFIEAMENIPEPNDKLKKAFRDFNKQETLEEVAERLYPNYQQEIFIKGAKWQQEQQDKFAIEFGDWIGKNTIAYNNGKFRMKTLPPVFLTSEQLLEQFKKK